MAARPVGRATSRSATCWWRRATGRRRWRRTAGAWRSREALAARDPANTGWQRDLSVSHDRIGDVLVAQGDGPQALAAYRRGLAIREALAARDPANTEWQRDLSVSHNKIGDVLVAQGDGPQALAAYRRGLAIRRGAGRARPGEHRMAARPVGQPQQDRRRAGGAGRRAAGAGGVPQGPGDRRDAGRARPGQCAMADRRGGVVQQARHARARAGRWTNGARTWSAGGGGASCWRLKAAGRLLPSQDWTGWFDERLAELPRQEPCAARHGGPDRGRRRPGRRPPAPQVSGRACRRSPPSPAPGGSGSPSRRWRCCW